MGLIERAGRERWSVARLKAEATVTASAKPEESLPGAVRTLGPATLEAAETYLGHLARAGDAQRLNASVRERVERVAELSGTLAREWSPQA